MKTVNDRLKIIDALRAFSILYIIGFWHLMDYTGTFSFVNVEIASRLTVVILGIFVFLSGFLLAGKPINLSFNNILEFYKKRLIRIYPLYFLSLIIFTLIKIYDSQTLLRGVVLLPIFDGNPLSTLWFINMIILYYFFAPFLVISTSQLNKFLLLFFGLLSILTLYFFLSNTLDVRTLIYFPAFAFGIYASRSLKAQNAWLYLVLVLACIISLFISVNSKGYPERSLESIPLALTIPAIVYFILVYFEKYIPNFLLDNRFISVVSYSSYSMYLLHRPIYKISKYLFFPENLSVQLIYLLGAVLPIIILSSWIQQKCYDKFITYINNYPLKNQNEKNRVH